MSYNLLNTNDTNNGNSTYQIIECNPFVTNDSSLFSFARCYGHFVRLSLPQTIFEYILGVSIVIVNAYTFGIIFKRRKENKVFDKILMAHTVVELFIGGFDLPFFHISTIFGYWPFSTALCMIWSILDNALNTITILHMTYLSYVRVECVLNPSIYQKKFLVKKPYLVSLAMWILGIVIWIPINLIYIKASDDMTFNCSIPYSPYYVEFILTVTIFFAPLCVTLGCMLYIRRILQKKVEMKRKADMLNLKVKPTTVVPSNTNTSNSSIEVKSLFSRRFSISADTRISIILVVYLFQWLPAGFVWVINSLCETCISDTLSNATYWLTFCVSLTDPIAVLILNARRFEI